MVAVGRYQLEREVARGGAATVWRARAPDGAVVAVKLLFAPLTDEARRRRFQLEVQALLRVAHPNLVRLLDAGQHEGRPYLVLQWIEGESLEDRLRRAGPLDPRDAARLVARLARALEHCHAQGVLHRDLKPANVLLRAADGEPLLTDFGLARDLSASLDGSVQGRLLGTPGYWPPEQAQGEVEGIGPRADVWGLGALLFGLLTGRPPFDSGDLLSALAALDRPAAPPSAVRPGIPAQLDAVCLRCLQRDPADRWPDAGALALALEGWLAPSRSSREGRPARPVEVRSRRGPVGVALAGTALFALVAALGPRTGGGAGPADHAAPGSSAPIVASPSSATASPAVTAAVTLAPAHAAAHEAIQEASARAAAGDLDHARALHDRAIELEPACPDALVARARFRSKQGDRRGALADYTATLRLKPHWAEVWSERGSLRDDLGDQEGALADYERALRHDPRCGSAWINRGVLRHLRGQLEAARGDYTRATEVEPENPLGWLNLGNLRLETGEHEAARDDFERALRLDPEQGHAWRGRGLARFGLGDLQGSIGDLDRAAQLDPADPSRHFDRARVLLPLGRHEDARAALDRTVELAPGESAAWQARAAMRELQGDPTGALADWDRAVALGPDDPDAWAGRGSFRAAGDPAGAREDLDRALRLDPDHLDGLLARGRLRHGAGDPAGALQDLDRWLGLAPADDADRAEVQALVAGLRAAGR